MGLSWELVSSGERGGGLGTACTWLIPLAWSLFLVLFWVLWLLVFCFSCVDFHDKALEKGPFSQLGTQIKLLVLLFQIKTVVSFPGQLSGTPGPPRGACPWTVREGPRR